MNIKQTTLAAVLTLSSLGSAHADGLKPFQGRVIDLRDVSAVAYYTVERDGYRVIATRHSRGGVGADELISALDRRGRVTGPVTG